MSPEQALLNAIKWNTFTAGIPDHAEITYEIPGILEDLAQQGYVIVPKAAA